MARMTKKIRDTLARFFARRTKQRSGPASPASGDTPGPQDSLVFDTITLESIVSLRGQNPFPEEEGELGYMAHTLHERSLHSR